MEAERNLALKRPPVVERLHRLMDRVEPVMVPHGLSLDHGLPPKVQPILAAAIDAGCQVLLTGDIADSGHLIGQTVENVRGLTASLFLAEHPDET